MVYSGNALYDLNSSITQKKTDGKEDGGTLEKLLMH